MNAKLLILGSKIAAPAITPPPPPPAQAGPAAVPSVPAATPIATVAPVAASKPVVIAPLTQGKSFRLRVVFNTMTQVGQMLVLVDRWKRDLPMEVVACYFPKLLPGRTCGNSTERFFMGERKVAPGYEIMVMDIRTTRKRPTEPPLLEYQLMNIAQKVRMSWQVLDLAKLRLVTTEAQRKEISEFTGVDYRTQEPDTAQFRNTVRIVNGTRLMRTYTDGLKPVGPRKYMREDHCEKDCLGSVFERAEIKEAKVQKLHDQLEQPPTKRSKKHRKDATVRSHLRSQLQSEALSYPSIRSSRKGAEPISAEPVVATDHALDTKQPSVSGFSIELAARIVTQGPNVVITETPATAPGDPVATVAPEAVPAAGATTG